MSLPRGVTRSPSGVRGSYLYRGARISRHERAGSWLGDVGALWADDHARLSASTLRHLVRLIDRHLGPPAGGAP